jgi:hypothetical protein
MKRMSARQIAQITKVKYFTLPYKALKGRQKIEILEKRQFHLHHKKIMTLLPGVNFQ